MEITAALMQEAREATKGKLSDDILAALLEKLPNKDHLGMLLPMAVEILRDAPEGIEGEQAANLVIKQLQKQSNTQKPGNPANAKGYTRAYFDSLWLEQRLMNPVTPDTTFTLYGETFASPIMTAALSHLRAHAAGGENAMAEFARGAYKAGCVHWIGMGEDDEFAQVTSTGARTIRIIKPYADEEKILRQIHASEEAGALAVGMDIDHVFTANGNPDICMGELLEPKSSAKMRSYVESTSLPFVIKGVLSVRDAAAAAEIGAKGIVVSHHGGRMNYAVPPLVILPDIAREVGSVMPIFVDCGIASGADAYKALALGAAAVSVGTHLMPLVPKGADAVADRLTEMTAELKGFMANTGVADVNSFDPTVIHRI